VARYEENYAVFRMDALDEVVGDNCQSMYFLSESTVQLASSCLRYAEYLNRAHKNKFDSEPTDQQRQTLQDWFELAQMEITLDCNDSLERIAVALESIEQNSGLRYTVEELLEDLELLPLAGGVLKEVVSGIFDLMPNLKIKADAMPILMALLETYTRWRPLHEGVNKIAGGVIALAAVSGGSKVIACVKAIVDSVLTLSTFQSWKQLLTLDEDSSIWDSLACLWDLVISIGDGGSAEDPDNDPSLRPIINVQSRNEVQNFINACCMGVPDFDTVDVSGIPPVEQISEVGEEVEPIDAGSIVWGALRSDTGKCQAARAVLAWARELLHTISTSLPGTNIRPSDIIAIVVTIAAASVTAPPIALVGMIGIATALAAVSLTNALSGVVDTVSVVLFDASEQLVCDMVESTSVEGAQNRIKMTLAEFGLQPVLIAASNYLFSNTVLSAVFYTVPGMDVSSFSSSCVECEGSCPLYMWGPGEEVEEYVFESTAAGGFYHVSIQFNTETISLTGPWCGGMQTFTILTDGWTVAPAYFASNFRAWEDDDAPITSTNATEYNSDTHPGSFEFTARSLSVVSLTPFTLEVIPV